MDASASASTPSSRAEATSASLRPGAATRAIQASTSSSAAGAGASASASRKSTHGPPCGQPAHSGSGVRTGGGAARSAALVASISFGELATTALTWSQTEDRPNARATA